MTTDCIKLTARFFLLLLIAAVPGRAGQSENRLPAAATQALHAPGKVILYSLEPWDHLTVRDKTFHDVKVLGQVELTGPRSAAAIAEFEAVVAGWDGMSAACFDPRHALRVVSKGHTYDFLLCYDCRQLEIYRDGKPIGSVGATGSPKALNELLSAAHVPLSQSGQQLEAQEKQAEEAAARWLAAMPKSIAPVWENAFGNGPDPDLREIRAALAREYPDTRQRILTLFAWYGSGAGPWSGFPFYESAAEELLLDFPTPDLVAAAQSEGLTEPQLEGAARLFGGWDFGQRRPEDRKALPADLKKKLLAHSLQSTDEDKLKRARVAFSGR